MSQRFILISIAAAVSCILVLYFFFLSGTRFLDFQKYHQQQLSSSSSLSSSQAISAYYRNIVYNDEVLFQSQQIRNTDWFRFHEEITHHRVDPTEKKKNKLNSKEEESSKNAKQQFDKTGKKNNRQIPYAKTDDVGKTDLLLAGDVEQELRREAPRLCKARWKHHRSRMFPSTSTTAAARSSSSSLDKCIDRVTEHYANWTRDRIPSPHLFLYSSTKEQVRWIPPQDNIVFNTKRKSLGRNDRASADLYSQFRLEFVADSTVRQVFEQIVESHDFRFVYTNDGASRQRTLGSMKQLLNISFRGPRYSALRLPGAILQNEEKLLARLIASARVNNIEIFSPQPSNAENEEKKKSLSKQFLDFVEPAFCSLCSEWQRISFRFDYTESNLFHPDEKATSAIPSLFFVFGDGADDDEDQNVEENKNRLLKHKLHSSYQKCKDPGARTRQCAHDVMTNTNAKKIVFFTLAVHQAMRWLQPFRNDTERIRKGIRAQLNFLASRRNVWLYVFVASQLDCLNLKFSPGAHKIMRKHNCTEVNYLVNFIEEYVKEYWKELQEVMIGSPRRMLHFPTVRTQDIRAELLKTSTRMKKAAGNFFATKEGIHLTGAVQTIHTNYLMKAVASALRCYPDFSSYSSSSSSVSSDDTNHNRDKNLFPEECIDHFSVLP